MSRGLRGLCAIEPHPQHLHLALAPRHRPRRTSEGATASVTNGLESTEHSPSSRGPWIARIVVYTAFVVVVWMFGPRALEVLEKRVSGASRHSPLVDRDRVELVARPPWLTGNLLTVVTRDLQVWLRGESPILDDAAARQLVSGLATVPWVEETRLERVFPDKFKVAFGLRRPVVAVRDEAGKPLCFCDKNGIALPFVEGVEVPDVVLRRDGGRPSMEGGIGEKAPDDRVLAAVQVAVEWRDELAPLVNGCPRLLEVDANNLDLRWAKAPEYPEIRVRLQRHDGAPVVFGYDHPVGSKWPRVPVATKAKVLNATLAEFAGLRGLVSGDLRFEVRWRDWLKPRQGA